MSESVNTLEAWLGTATEGLTQPGKERIALEIASHFEDAVASYRADDLAEGDAQARALADLGSPQEAARRFRKRHLTQSEADFLERKLSNYRKWRKPWVEVLFWIVFGCLYYLLMRAHASPLLLSIWAPMYVAQSLSILMTASRWDFRSLRIMLATDALGWISTFIFLGCIIGLLGAGIVIVVNSWNWFRVIYLWLKLGRLADLGQEMRPPSAIVS